MSHKPHHPLTFSDRSHHPLTDSGKQRNAKVRMSLTTVINQQLFYHSYIKTQPLLSESEVFSLTFLSIHKKFPQFWLNSIVYLPYLFDPSYVPGILRHLIRDIECSHCLPWRQYTMGNPFAIFNCLTDLQTMVSCVCMCVCV